MYKSCTKQKDKLIIMLASILDIKTNAKRDSLIMFRTNFDLKQFNSP